MDDGTCRACSAPLLWAITKAGKRAPLTAHPHAEGNVLVWKDADGVVRCASFGPVVATQLRAEGVPLRLNHFADCKQADRFRPEAAHA